MNSGHLACVAGVEGEGNRNKRAREARDEGAREGRPVTQAKWAS